VVGGEREGRRGTSMWTPAASARGLPPWHRVPRLADVCATAGRGCSRIASRFAHRTQRLSRSRHGPRIERTAGLLPARIQQPRTRRQDHLVDRFRVRWPRDHSHVLAPAVELGRRGEGIEHDTRFAPEAGDARVPAVIEKHIRDTNTDLPRALEVARMVALGEDAPPPPELTVQRSRDSDRERRQPAGQRALVVCFHEQVEMVALHREVHDSEAPAALAGPERPPHGVEAHLRPQVRHSEGHPQRHVHRMAPVVVGPGAVRHPGVRVRLPTGVLARPAPPQLAKG